MGNTAEPLSTKELKDLRTKYGNKKLTFPEVKQLVQEVARRQGAKSPLPDDYIRKLFDQLDREKSGYLDFSELEGVYVRQVQLNAKAPSRAPPKAFIAPQPSKNIKPQAKPTPSKPPQSTPPVPAKLAAQGEADERDAAATKIQASFRGQQERKKLAAPHVGAGSATPNPKATPARNPVVPQAKPPVKLNPKPVGLPNSQPTGAPQQKAPGRLVSKPPGAQKAAIPPKPTAQSVAKPTSSTLDENQAATKIQASFRGQQARKNLAAAPAVDANAPTRNAPAAPQAKPVAARPNPNPGVPNKPQQAAHSAASKPAAQGEADERDAAATKIQASFRGQQERKKLAAPHVGAGSATPNPKATPARNPVVPQAKPPVKLNPKPVGLPNSQPTGAPQQKAPGRLVSKPPGAQKAAIPPKPTAQSVAKPTSSTLGVNQPTAVKAKVGQAKSSGAPFTGSKAKGIQPKKPPTVPAEVVNDGTIRLPVAAVDIVSAEAIPAATATSASPGHQSVDASKSTAREDSAKPAYYLVDNIWLGSSLPGLAYTKSKDLNDAADGGLLQSWGTLVAGIDNSDGWLEVGDYFLPFKLHGVPVLTLRAGPKPSATRAVEPQEPPIPPRQPWGPALTAQKEALQRTQKGLGGSPGAARRGGRRPPLRDSRQAAEVGKEALMNLQASAAGVLRALDPPERDESDSGSSTESISGEVSRTWDQSTRDRRYLHARDHAVPFSKPTKPVEWSGQEWERRLQSAGILAPQPIEEKPPDQSEETIRERHRALIRQRAGLSEPEDNEHNVSQAQLREQQVPEAYEEVGPRSNNGIREQATGLERRSLTGASTSSVSGDEELIDEARIAREVAEEVARELIPAVQRPHLQGEALLKKSQIYRELAHDLRSIRETPGTIWAHQPAVGQYPMRQPQQFSMPSFFPGPQHLRLVGDQRSATELAGEIDPDVPGRIWL